MAIVVDKAAPFGRPDYPLCTPSRNNAGTPVASLTPAFPGEIVMDTTNRVLWRAVGPANTNWIVVQEYK